MNVLVTGGAGFIGSHTEERLLRDNVPLTYADVSKAARLPGSPPHTPISAGVRYVAWYLENQHPSPLNSD